jgi:hypothetical protein
VKRPEFEQYLMLRTPISETEMPYRKSSRYEKRVAPMTNRKTKIIMICFLACSILSSAAEFSPFRLLSVSESEKLILVSQIPGKSKYILDAASAKITLNGKPAEFKALKAFSRIEVKMELRKINKLGIAIDGIATEIKMSTEEEPN